MEIVVGLLVIGGFIVGGMLLQNLGENLADGTGHVALKVLGVVVMVIGIVMGAVISLGIAQLTEH
jgi:hypothetical protein